MDPRAFDELSRQLGEKTSRRKVLKLFGGALVGTLVGADMARANPPEKHCKFEGYGCGDNTDCCSQLCCNRTCCGTGQVCSGGMCTGGTSPPPPPSGCTDASQCPQPMTNCQTATCVAGVCGFMNAPAGTACPGGACDGAGQCVQSGGCVPACTAPQQCCNGTCVDVNSNVANCGMCGHVCSLPNATAACAGGACVVASCNFGFADCDGQATTGCETPILSDPNNCGGCNIRCTCMSGTPVCNGGFCMCV
jgi:hypothetical protein